MSDDEIEELAPDEWAKDPLVSDIAASHFPAAMELAVSKPSIVSHAGAVLVAGQSWVVVLPWGAETSPVLAKVSLFREVEGCLFVCLATYVHVASRVAGYVSVLEQAKPMVFMQSELNQAPCVPMIVKLSDLHAVLLRLEKSASGYTFSKYR